MTSLRANTYRREAEYEHQRQISPLDDLFGLLADPEREWQDQAICAQTDPESFFPKKGGTTAPAKKICLDCPVRAECLDYALAHNERFGIWGGLSERERHRLKRGEDVTPAIRGHHAGAA